VYTEGFLGVTPPPAHAREGLSQHLDKPVMGAVGGGLNAREASVLQLSDEPAPPLSGLTEGGQRRPRISR